MAGKRISDLDPISGAATANDDKLVIYDTSTASTKRIDRSQLAAGIVGDLPYTPSGGISATTVPTAIAELATDLTGVAGQVSSLRRESVAPLQNISAPAIPAFTATWAAAQFFASGASTILVPHIPTGGSGDEGYRTITADGPGGRNKFDTMDGLVLGNAVAYDASGASQTITAVSKSTDTPPAAPTVTFAVPPAPWTQGDLIHLWRRAGRFRVTRRAAGIKVTVNLLHGAITSTDLQITVTAYLNGSAVTAAKLSMEQAPTGEVSTTGTILLPMARGNGATQDVLYLELFQTNGGADIIGVQVGSRVTIEAMGVQPLQGERLVGGIHQGAQLTDAEIASVASIDLFPVSGMWTGQIAQSGATAHGQELFDGYVSTAWPGLADRLNAARAARSTFAQPGGPKYLAYMTATIGAPDGTFSGQARYTRFSTALGNLTPGQTAFTANYVLPSTSPATVVFQPLSGQFTCSAWVQTVTVAGQYLIGYGALYDEVSPGVYETTTTVGSLTATLRWSGSGNRDLTLTMSTPPAVGDYVAIGQFVNRFDDPWFMNAAGRQNVRQMVSRTFGNSEFTTQMDGVFLDLCPPAFISSDDLNEVVGIVRPFAPQGNLMMNITVPTPEGVEHVASCSNVLPGDIVFLEGGGCKVGVDNITNTLRAVTERDRISRNGKHLRLCWLSTIEQSAAGPVTSDSRIIKARNDFLANSQPGDIFMCHWSGLGTPYNNQPRPMPTRMSGITQWDGN